MLTFFELLLQINHWFLLNNSKRVLIFINPVIKSYILWLVAFTISQRAKTTRDSGDSGTTSKELILSGHTMRVKLDFEHTHIVMFVRLLSPELKYSCLPSPSKNHRIRSR